MNGYCLQAIMETRGEAVGKRNSCGLVGGRVVWKGLEWS